MDMGIGDIVIFEVSVGLVASAYIKRRRAISSVGFRFFHRIASSMDAPENPFLRSRSFWLKSLCVPHGVS
jgi:hypothetical protein